MGDELVAQIAGKSVVIVHPAWHSCGSHAVFCTQAAAYAALQATAISLAAGTTPDAGLHAHGFWSEYYSKTTDLGAATRSHTGLPRMLSFLVSPSRMRAAIQMLTGTYAQQLAVLSELSPIPHEILQAGRIDLIHCNHYFNMPLALRLKARTGAPILLDTHDIQSRQMQLSGKKARLTGRRASFQELLETELSFLRQADTLVHINSEEYEFFRNRLPDKRHKLIYPPIKLIHPPINMPLQERGDPYFLIVAGGNYGNYVSVAWFLEEVAPSCPGIAVKIAGNVDGFFAARRPDLLHKYRSSFLGRVESLGELYAGATAILLPTVSGHGLSIKTLEAMSTGLPIIAMPLAFRGLAINFGDYPNIHLVRGAEAFAKTIVERHEAVPACTQEPAGSELRAADPANLRQVRRWSDQEKAQAAFNRHFSFDAYKENLAAIVHELLGERAAVLGGTSAVERASSV